MAEQYFYAEENVAEGELRYAPSVTVSTPYQLEDGLDLPTADEKSPSSAEFESGSHVQDAASELSLRNHMGRYPAYFDSTIAEHERAPWARSRLSDELAAYDSKRLQFERDRTKWEERKKELQARKVLELRKAVVRQWIKEQEKGWGKSRIEWTAEELEIEESLRVELKKFGVQDQHVNQIPLNLWGFK